MNFWTLVADLGLPIAATIGLGAFIMIIIKYILGSVVGSIQFIESVIQQLDNRVKTMNNDIIKIDQEVSEQLGLPVDTDRVARADGKKDARKDQMQIVTIINEYGFPIVAMFFLAYFIWFLYNYIVKEIKPKLSNTSTTLIALIDRVRMLDNDLIRLHTKVRTLKKKKKQSHY